MRMTAEIGGKSGRKRGKQQDEEERKIKQCNYSDLMSSHNPLQRVQEKGTG